MPTSAPLRVLVVDDDALSRDFQTHLLALLGHHAEALADPALAATRALDGSFDVLLLDLGMPEIDGFEVLRRLRERERQWQRRPLAVLAVTGYASPSDRQRCLDAGFDGHLAKPIQAGRLSEAIGRVLGARAADPTTETSDVARLRATVARLKVAPPHELRFGPTVTESFALRSAQLLESLRLCAQRRDSTALARAAQTLKASTEFLGALRLAGMSAALEHAADRGDWGAVESTLGSMTSEHQVVLTVLFEASRG